LNRLTRQMLEKFEQMNYFFNPSSIALIGAGKSNPFTVSNIILSNILAEGYSGNLFLVDIQPQQDSIMNLKVFRSLFELPQKVDLALIIVPATVVPQVIEECIEASVKAIIVITAGFIESLLYDQTGIKLQEEIERKIRKSKIRIVGPNCNGVYSQICNLNATLGPRVILPPGNFSMVTRGGTAGILLNIAAARNTLGINKYIGIGDESDLTLQDFVQYFEHDADTQIIGAYTEGIKNARSFCKVLGACQKPMVIFNSGQTPSGARAAVSHVGAIAGEFTSKIFEGALRQLKVIRVTSIDDFIDFATAASLAPLPRGKNVGIWTPGGSMGVIMSDYLEKEGLRIPKLSQEQIEQLNKVLKVKYWSHSNPVDVTDSYSPQSIDKAAEILLASANIDGLIILFGFALTENSEYIDFPLRKEYEDMFEIFINQQARRFGKLIKKYQKPIFLLTDGPNETAKLFYREGVIVLPTFQRIARTFKMLYQRYQYLNQK
jgi:acyl-CoA synthetase (NDP forming)